MRCLKFVLPALCLLWPAAAPWAAFQAPLETPAAMSAIASRSRLIAVSQSGDRLVSVGQKGHILISSDGGNNWQQRAVPVSSDLVALDFPSAGKRGWAVGHDGVILQSDDGGLTWSKQLDGRQIAASMLALYQQQLKGGDATAASRLSEIRRFAEEGADKPFLDVAFVNAQEGFAVGAFNLIMHTNDGGRSWTPLSDRSANPKGAHLYAIRAADEEVYLAGEMGLLRRWDRATQRFLPLRSPYPGSYFGLLAKGATVIVYGIRGNAFRSDDRGQSWRRLDLGTTAGLTAGAMSGDGRVVLASQLGEVLVSADGSDSFTRLRYASPMPIYGMTGVGGDKVVLVGARGAAVVSLDK